MPIAMFKAARYPSTDRVDLAKAAFTWCQSVRSVEGARARFFWDGPNDVGFLIEAESMSALMTATANADSGVPAELTTAMLALADLAAPERPTYWVDPKAGEEVYRQAGRLA